MNEKSPRRPWFRPLMGCLIVFVMAAVTMSYLFLGRWTDVKDAEPSEAGLVFAAAIITAGGGTPYIEIADDGTVLVHHNQEPGEPEKFDTLTLLAWTPTDEKILRLDYPRWFVQLKTSTSVNLGTMIAAARGDWGQLDLSINFDDLSRRGPALLLDHQLENGARIVLWTSAGSG